jgi:oxygen-independent coproporphyrinogen-3 oxidase
MKTKRPLSIYIHIPFCVRKCLYCDFLSAPASGETMEAYASCLCREIEAAGKLYPDYEVRTVFFGGGTPSILKKERICQIMEVLRRAFSLAEDAEITIEVNPGTVDADKLAAYYAAGINRLSIGVQSLQENELQALGRIHSTEDFFQTYSMAIKSGFNNINVDLMSAIPEQTLESCQDTLRQLLSLDRPPSHISAYSLIIEEGTPFYENTPVLPDEEMDRLFYKITNDILKAAGYHRYEISNYAREGCECRHNRVYWERGEYLGFGTGAASLMQETRFSNIRDLQTYLKLLSGEAADGPSTGQLTEHLRQEVSHLTEREQMEEFMFLGLRLTEGVSKKRFFKTFGKKFTDVYPGISEKLIREGLLVQEGDRLKLTELGLDVSNRVMAEFLFD